MADVEAAAKVPKDKATKPDKPDDEEFKSELAKAEKDLEKARARLVRSFCRCSHPHPG
jgi:hypothetical protein